MNIVNLLRTAFLKKTPPVASPEAVSLNSRKAQLQTYLYLDNKRCLFGASKKSICTLFLIIMI